MQTLLQVMMVQIFTIKIGDEIIQGQKQMQQQLLQVLEDMTEQQDATHSNGATVELYQIKWYST